MLGAEDDSAETGPKPSNLVVVSAVEQALPSLDLIRGEVMVPSHVIQKYGCLGGIRNEEV